MDIYGLLRGPLLWVALGIFIVGLIYQAQRFLAVTREHGIVGPPAPMLKGVDPAPAISFTDFSNSFFGVHPVVAFVTTIFHVMIVMLPVFVLGHNVLLEESTGFSFFVYPEILAEIMTLLVILGGLFFLLRRIFIRRVRVISSLYDYIILFLAVAPFLTGFLATRQMFDYNTILILHILTGELMLIAIPFTKLKHGLLFFLYRYKMNYEHCLGTGRRAWSYNQAKLSSQTGE